MATFVKSKIGLSRFTLGLLAGFLVGIFFGNFISISFYYFLISALILIVIASIIRKRNLTVLILITLVGLSLGLASYRYFDAKEVAKKLDYNQVREFEVTVVTSIKKNSSQQIVAKYLNTKLQIDTSLYPEFVYGDKLKIEGEIQNPNGIILSGFDYGNYLLKKGIRGTVKNPKEIQKIGWQGNFIIAGILKVSDKFRAVINKELPEPMSTLMIGLLMGLKQQLPDSVTTAFQRTGLSHVTAVSGYNVTIVIIWLSFLLTYISRRGAFFGTILATIIFVVMTGAGASVMRAGILAILILFGKFIGRKVYYPILILLVADVMLSLNPYGLKNDASFQLSFLAFVGLLILSTPISTIKYLQFIPESLRQVLSETLGAQILVLPILIYNFGLVSVIAPVANIIVLPIIPFIMLLGFISGIAGLIWLKLGLIISGFSWLILKYILVVVENLSQISWAAFTFKTEQWWWIPLYYFMIYIAGRKNESSKL